MTDDDFAKMADTWRNGILELAALEADRVAMIAKDRNVEGRGQRRAARRIAASIRALKVAP